MLLRLFCDCCMLNLSVVNLAEHLFIYLFFSFLLAYGGRSLSSVKIGDNLLISNVKFHKIFQRVFFACPFVCFKWCACMFI
jgi:hypothetical protein